MDYELIKVSFPPSDPDFLAGDPTRTLPLFVDGETRITEFIAILQYLAERHDPTGLSVKGDEVGFGEGLRLRAITQ